METEMDKIEKMKEWTNGITDEDTPLLQYIKTIGNMEKQSRPEVGAIYEWILANGKHYVGTDMGLADEVVEASYVKPRLKDCYYSSMVLFGHLQYVEGWANLVIPLPHAWNTINEQVVDVTMTIPEHRDSEFKDFTNQEYFGVEIPKDWIMNNLGIDTKYRIKNTAGPFIWDYALHCMKQEEE